jgi:hypothetical protein
MSKKLANLNYDIAALASATPLQRAPDVFAEGRTIVELTNLGDRIRDLEARVERLEAGCQDAREGVTIRR